MYTGKKDLRFYFKLFLSTFYLSAFTFGGGYVIVSFMRKKFVEDYKWIDEKEMLDMLAIAQSSPGPIAVNCSLLIGYRLAGVAGAAITIIGTVTPPLIIISVISFFYTAFKQNEVINLILKGMGAGVAAVVADVTINMASQITGEKSRYSIFLMIAAFTAVFVFDADVKLVLIAGALLGLAAVYYKRARQKRGGR